MKEYNKIAIIPAPGESEEAFLSREKKIGAVEVVYSNKGLSFFEGGCSFIEPDSVQIQLRKSFEKKRRFLWIYDREEILAHEKVHAMRCAFDEPKFEEILAYQTSKSAFRRYFGPIFRNSTESYIFLIASLFSLLSSFFLLIPLYGLARLVYYQSIFAKTKKKVQNFDLLIRLTDDEIINYKDDIKNSKELRLRNLILN